MRGLWSVGVDNQQWVVPAIHAVWIPPYRAHSLRSHGAYSGWSVYIEEAACALLPTEPCTIRMSALLREAVKRAAGWHSDVLDEAQLRIAGVIVDEIRGLPRERLGLPMPEDARLQRIAEALSRDLADNRRLEEWAAWAAVSPRTLSRRFVDETGFSFAEWRQQARLLRALEMLATDLPVTTVALELGYDTEPLFSVVRGNCRACARHICWTGRRGCIAFVGAANVELIRYAAEGMPIGMRAFAVLTCEFGEVKHHRIVQSARQ
jgi:AraC-like DNA-binding protein